MEKRNPEKPKKKPKKKTRASYETNLYVVLATNLLHRRESRWVA